MLHVSCNFVADGGKKRAARGGCARSGALGLAWAPSYPVRLRVALWGSCYAVTGMWLFGLFAACWGSHQPLFLVGAGQFLEHNAQLGRVEHRPPLQHLHSAGKPKS